jgi:hypothetical protein
MRRRLVTAAKTGRGSTRTSRPAALPGPAYLPPPRRRSEDGTLSVDFHGEDSRQRRFEVSVLPLPGWHAPLAAALELRIGPTGRVRTLASARTSWEPVGRLLRFLARLPHPPEHPGELTASQMEAFYQHRAETNQQAHAWHDVRAVGQLLELAPTRGLVDPEVLDFVARRNERPRTQGRPGYSDGELSRLLVAARRDAARIRDRIDAAEALLDRFRTAPDETEAADRAHALPSMPWRRRARFRAFAATDAWSGSNALRGRASCSSLLPIWLR